ncbi:MAG: hypothetical protein Q8M76_03160 [Spirochaetaceae bacterium]|nr:hypothetical protein [Spirochaetaceae bacterium]
MKKILGILAVLVALSALVGCASAPEPIPGPVINPDQPVVKAYPPQILEHKGTAFGRDYPKWMDAALDGPKAVEKLSDFSNQYVVVVQQDGQDLAGTQLAASRLDAQTTIAAMISTRVKDTFAGAQVGDKDKIETYMERCVKSASEAQFTGFAQLGDWWAKLQTFTSAGKPDKQVYRVIQVWGIDKALLKQQIEAILSGEESTEPKTEEKQRAMDMVQLSFFDGF